MSQLFKLCVLALCVCINFSAISGSWRSSTRGTHCKHKGVSVAVGEEYIPPPGNCYKFTCHKSVSYIKRGGTLSSRTYCDTREKKPDCYYGKRDYTKEYPDCCPQLICLDDMYDIDG